MEYDGKADRVRFLQRAELRRFRGATLNDEISGSLIVYDNATDMFSVDGGTNARSPSNPSGRVRAVLGPRAAASAAAPAAAAATPSGSAPPVVPTLRTSPALGASGPRP